MVKCYQNGQSHIQIVTRKLSSGVMQLHPRNVDQLLPMVRWDSSLTGTMLRFFGGKALADMDFRRTKN